MTEEPDWRDRVTAAFLEREGDGVGAALQQARVGGNSDTDAAVLERADALLAAYDPVPHLLRNDGDHDRSPAAVEEHLRTVTGLLAADRTLLMAALYSPLALVAAVDRRHGGLGPHRQWIAWCWTVEAVWWCVARVDGTAPDGFTATELDILLPVAARQRCVAFTEAYRSSGGGPADRMAGTAPRVFGTGTAHLFVARSVEARRAWVEFLDQYESHIALGRADPSALEREVTALLFGGGRRGPLLGVSSARLHALATGGGRQRRLLERDDRRIAHDLAEHHLLPRFRLWDTLRVAAATAQRPRFGLLTTVATAAAALAMPLLVAAAPRWPELAGRTTLTLAAAAAGLCCLLGVVGIVAHGRMWALPWLLRVA
ncbi:hypothetical protein, partial [Thermobifida halotolerans]|uniref:hypothetical protein n=1 Tax=Thermobifida halotolerans TaxID=483545 RepID=UPI001F1E6B0F